MSGGLQWGCKQHSWALKIQVHDFTCWITRTEIHSCSHTFILCTMMTWYKLLWTSVFTETILKGRTEVLVFIVSFHRTTFLLMYLTQRPLHPKPLDMWVISTRVKLKWFLDVCEVQWTEWGVPSTWKQLFALIKINGFTHAYTYIQLLWGQYFFFFFCERN